MTHLIDVEGYWYQIILGGLETDGDLSELPADADADTLIATYEQACAASRRVEAQFASLDDESRGGVKWNDNAHPTLRWVMIHLIEELARHNGHLDLLRELYDGSVGD